MVEDWGGDSRLSSKLRCENVGSAACTRYSTTHHSTTLPLTLRAVERTPLLLHLPTDGVATRPAWQTVALVDSQAVGMPAGLAVGVEIQVGGVHVEGRPAVFDGCRQLVHDRAV